MDISLVMFVVIAALGAIVGFLLFAQRKVRSERDALREEYGNIIDKDIEIKQRQTAIRELTDRRESLESEYKSRFTELSNEYLKNRALYDSLTHEVKMLEETLEMQSFGIYKPHYDYSTSEEFKRQLEIVIDRQKTLIKQETAAVCTTQWRINNSIKEGEKQTKQYTKLMLRAFNGECDSIMGKVRWNNITTMEERIRKAFDAINRLGTVHNSHITDEYLQLKFQELFLTFEYQEKLYQEKEEQRRIQEQIREEEKVQREIEQAKKDAEVEEKRYQKALEKARAELEKATDEEMTELNEKIASLQTQLTAAQELKERAISRAQVTKSGHVYVISNIGSFGESVFKIGMTRRLEPFDRIKELGDASVPFPFDVHAMIYSDDAPSLESRLHGFFEQRRVNLVNNRKEFFGISIADIDEFSRMNDLSFTITKLAEAKEYRETLALREDANKKANQTVIEDERFPSALFTT